MSAQKNILLGIMLLLMIFVISGCSSTDAGGDKADIVLNPSSQVGCDPGFIRPPGVHNCIYIANIIADKAMYLAPQGRCPTHWQRLKSKGFCLPKYSLIGCGEKTFSCEREKNDSFKVIPETPKCPEGTITVTTEAPLFDENGALFLGTRQTLACGPVPRGVPV